MLSNPRRIDVLLLAQFVLTIGNETSHFLLFYYQADSIFFLFFLIFKEFFFMDIHQPLFHPFFLFLFRGPPILQYFVNRFPAPFCTFVPLVRTILSFRYLYGKLMLQMIPHSLMLFLPIFVIFDGLAWE